MKDFSEWLNDLTGELQEPDKEAPVGWACGDDMDWKPVYAQSEPEDTFDGGMWAGDLARKLYEQQGGAAWTDELGKNMTATEVNRRQLAAGVKAHELMIESIKRLDRYRRNPYQWMESDENE